ncbi:MAG: hypothetical protein NVSMB17_16990 [Candidatus Dormibacteria bacterium]
MKLTVHFVDGENLDGEAEEVSLDRGGFKLVGTVGNTRSAWVGAGAIKYIVVHAASEERYGERDPRDSSDLTKVALHFLDGEVQHTYRDAVYAEQPGGFVVSLFDPDTHQLLRALVPGTSLKGVFVVEEWDSRTAEEKRRRAGARRRGRPHGPAANESSFPRPMSVPDPGLTEGGRKARAAVPRAPVPQPRLPPRETSTSEAAPPALAASDPGPEERRLGFVPGLAKRRRPTEAAGPGQERHEALRMRISELLGILGPPEDPPPT